MVFQVRSKSAPFVPAIVQTADPSNVRQYDLLQMGRPLGLLQNLTIEQHMSAIASDYLPSFGYYCGAFSSPVLASLYDSGLAKNVWQVRFLGLLQYPSVTDPAGQFSVKKSTWGGELNFTSTYWTKKLIGADAANAAGYDGKGVRVAVLDTGGTHVSVQTPLITKYTVVDANKADAIGHGQWCISAIVGRPAVDQQYSAENGKQVRCEGVAPGADGIEIKCLDYGMGSGSTYQLLKAWQMALDLGVNVCSCSWGGPSTETDPTQDVFYSPLQTMVKQGMIVVVAAGNSGPDLNTVDSPGVMPDALTVGSYNAVTNSNKAFGQAGEVSGFSSRGPTNWGDIKPDVLAPGAVIDSAMTGWMSGSYTGQAHPFQAIAGTSMATPIAAGLITLMFQSHRQVLGKYLTTDEIKKMMQGLGNNKDDSAGWGPITWDIYQKWVQTEYSQKGPLSITPPSSAQLIGEPYSAS